MDRDIGPDCEGRGRFTYHGGDLGAARTAFPDAPLPWLDLSTGINPVAYPVPPIPAADWTALPDAGAARRLEAAAAEAYGARADQVTGAPGTEALIQSLPRLCPARRVGVLGYTYADHGRAWRAAGATVETVDRLADLDRYDVAIVVNPNNPDGRLVPADDLAALSGRVGLLIVDEAFADVVPAAWSLAPAPPDRAVVLRSFGKFYGLAGLRLGFAIAGPAWTGRIRTALGPWSVSGPALTIGARALSDTAWAAATRARLCRDAARIDALLVACGATILGGTGLFRLAEVPDAARWFETLARLGVLTRPFADRPSWLRFGLPPDAAGWSRLSAALAGLSAMPR